MSTDIAVPVPGYGAGDRHGWLDPMCALLEKIIIGRHAGVLLEDPEKLPETAALAQLPIWWWTRPSAPVGRKDRSSDGGQLLLPVRINWVPAPVVVLRAGTELRARWSAVGLGRSGTGDTVLSIDPAHTGGPGYPSGTQMIGERAQFPLMSRRQLVVGLRRAVADGRKARWEALMALQPWVDRAVRNAHTAVAWEIGGRERPDRAAPAVLDPVGLDAVAIRLMLGEDGHDGEGLVGNLLDRCLLPATFSKVEPSRYIFTTLKRDAEQEIRREIGDPRIGPKVRAMMRTILAEGASIAEMEASLVGRYNTRYPYDMLSRRRAPRALNAAADPMALTRPLSERHHEGAVPTTTTPSSPASTPNAWPVAPNHRKCGDRRAHPTTSTGAAVPRQRRPAFRPPATSGMVDRAGLRTGESDGAHCPFRGGLRSRPAQVDVAPGPHRPTTVGCHPRR